MATSNVLPTYFLGHGGGPLPLLNDPTHSTIIKHWKQLSATITQPKAIVVISGHWEEKEVTVTAGSSTSLLYDYYGFPPESYEYKYPAPGDPKISERIQSLLTEAGIPNKKDTSRGLDHGVFVPLGLIFPKANIPVVQVSMLSSYDPKAHIEYGRALAPLRREGVLIIGSGFSFHNMRAFFGGAGPALSWSKAFNAYLIDACTKKTGTERDALLKAWASAPNARDCQPREDHLMPLHVVAGAAGNDAGHVIFRDNLLGIESVDFRFGEHPSC